MPNNAIPYTPTIVVVVRKGNPKQVHLINGPTSAISLPAFSSLAFIDPENRTVVFEALSLPGGAIGVTTKGSGDQGVLTRTCLTLFHGDAINPRTVAPGVTAAVSATLLRWLVTRFRLPQLDLLAVVIIAAVSS